MSHAALHASPRSKMPRIYWRDDMPQIAQVVIWPNQWSTFIYVSKNLPPGRAVAALRRATRSKTWLRPSHRHAAVLIVFAFAAAHMPFAVLSRLSLSTKAAAGTITAIGTVATVVTALAPSGVPFAGVAPGPYAPKVSASRVQNAQRRDIGPTWATAGFPAAESSSRAPAAAVSLAQSPPWPAVPAPSPATVPSYIPGPISSGVSLIPAHGVKRRSVPSQTQPPAQQPSWWWRFLPSPQGKHQIPDPSSSPSPTG